MSKGKKGNKLYDGFIHAIFMGIFLVVISSPVKSQDDFAWWNEVNNWDGHTHWSDYIIFSPYYMGPNSLPVPESQKGIIRSEAELRLDVVQSFSALDNTHYVEMHFYYPVVKDIIAIEFYGVPYESFKMEEELVIERRTRYRDGKGIAIGDFYFSTMIQLLKDRKFPDVVFRMAARTASGSQLANARYTDAPGYFFDISLGKTLIVNDNLEFRFSGMLGFYSWQMNLPNNRQNDAIIYGLGADILWKSWFLVNSIDGYEGYIGDEQIIVGNPDELVTFKDRPMLYRLEVGKRFSKMKFSLGYQHAIKDFYYDNLKFSMSYLF